MSDPLMRGERVLAESEPKIVNEVSILPNKAVAETPFKNKLGVLDAPAVSEYLTPPESVEEAKARDRLLWDILEEALNRGADADDLVELQFRYRRKRRPRANEVPRVNYLPASEDLDVTLVGDPASMTPEEEFAVKFSLEFVRLALVAYRRKAMSEFDRLDPRVRDTFKLRDKDAFEHYVEARPMYHNAGYTNPVAEVFAHLRPAVIVGRQVLVHAEYADKLAALDALLRAQGATLPEDVAQKITEAGGFYPRFIAGKTAMSNHALGRAIDIDSAWNPHIINKEVILALNEVVQGTGYDFGKKYDAPFWLLPSPLTLWQYTEQHPLVYLSEESDFGNVHAASRAASDAVKAWLNLHLPRYEELMTRIAAAEEEKKKFPKGSPEYQNAQAIIDEAHNEIAGSPDLSRLKVLHRHHSANEIKAWAAKGLQTLPLEFVAAMRRAGLKWGGEWKDSKDFMHFELPPAVKPTPTPKGFEDLLPQGIREEKPPPVPGKIKVPPRKLKPPPLR